MCHASNYSSLFSTAGDKIERERKSDDYKDLKVDSNPTTDDDNDGLIVRF